jgi:hypothetical protein
MTSSAMQSNLQNHSNHQVIRELVRARGDERRCLARILRLMGEVDRRRLYVELGYASLFEYCTEALGYSEDEAYRRIGVARAGRRYPLIIDMIERGELHLTGAARCAPQLTRDDYREILASVANKSKREIDEILAARSPQPDVEDSIEAVPAHENRTHIAPIAEDRFAISFTGSRKCRELIEHAKALMSHRNPRPGLGAIVEAALEAYVKQLEKQKFKTTDRPREPSEHQSEDPRHVPAHVKREVYRRDGRRCSFVSADGRRCDCRVFLELDHIVPVARGGKSTVDNLRLRCFRHNQFAARQAFGDPHMELMAAGFRPVTRRDRTRLIMLAHVPYESDPIGPTGSGTCSTESHRTTLHRNFRPS